MAEQRMKVRDKKVQKMTKDGLVEENLTDKSSDVYKRQQLHGLWMPWRIWS